MLVGISLAETAQRGKLFEPDATLALDFAAGRYRVGTGGYSSPDFASLPGLTVTRATPSTAYAETNAGVLVPFAANVARITDKGLLVEEARTNSIRNSAMAGASAGVAPTNWTFSDAGLTRTIVGAGTEEGWPYVDIRYNGTTSAVALEVKPDGNASVSGASASQAWAFGASLRLVAGSLTNVTDARLLVNEYSAGPTYLRTAAAVNSITPTASRARSSGAITTGASTTILEPIVAVRFAIGVAVDFTLRIYAPQLELGSFATSYIPTSGSTATRAADSVSVGGLSVPAVHSGVLRALWQSTVASTFPTAIQLDDGSSNGVLFYRNGGDSLVRYNTRAAGAQIFDAPFVASVAANTATSFAWRAQSGSYAASQAGAAAITNATATAIPATTTLRLGIKSDGTQPLNGYLQRVIIYPRAFSDAELVAATQ